MKRFPEAFNLNFSMELFKQRYASNDHADGNPFLNSTELTDSNFEWQAILHCEDGNGIPVRVLCCPEDIQRGAKCKHPAHELCGYCRVPICTTCQAHAWSAKHKHSIPMVLANDNFIGYATDIITRYGVRWLEAAVVMPCWTNMLVYYVEGDHGHLMGEQLGHATFRTVVRGNCISFQMPWEDILESLKHNCADRNP